MLELKNVSKTFNPGTVNEKKALDKLSLNLNEGDFVTIIGANGAVNLRCLMQSAVPSTLMRDRSFFTARI